MHDQIEMSRLAGVVRGLLGVLACGLILGLAVPGEALADATYNIAFAGAGKGTVVSSPAGLNCNDLGGSPSGECSFSEFPPSLFTPNVELAATASSGSQFEGWTATEEYGDCYSGTANPCSFGGGLGGEATITAHFGSDGPQQPLEVRLTGAGGGEVKSSAAGIACGTTCKAEFSEGSTVVLTAQPNGHSTFARWIGCNSINGEGKCEVTMSEAKSVEAEFAAIPQQTLEVKKTGSGEVTSSPASIACGTTCTSHFNEGSTVTLTATPAPAVPGARYTFAGWTGCSSVNGEGKCEVTMSEAKTVEAEFDLIPQQALKVQKTGSGEVTSSPSGISCGGTCEAEFDEGATVTLTAIPTSESFFAGWSGGGCTGTTRCEVTLGAATTVTATFEPIPPPTASTGGTTTVGQTTATLTSIVDGQGYDTYYVFEYGETASYGSYAPANNGVGEDAGVVATNTPETISVSDLTPNTTYHYKIVAYNIPCSVFCPRSGPNTVEGADRTFTTLALAPIALADPPGKIESNSATLTGSVNPQGVAGSYYFEYGTTTAYGTSLPEVPVAATKAGVVVSADVTGLEPNTTYHFRLVAANNGGATVADSPDEAFSTYGGGTPSTAPPPPGFALTGTAPAGPAAATFPNLSGLAPVAPPGTTTPRGPTKPLTAAEKLSAALKACKKDKGKTKRQKCEREARKKYGTKVTKKNSRKGRLN